MTMRYAHPAPAHNQDAVEKLVSRWEKVATKSAAPTTAKRTERREADINLYAVNGLTDMPGWRNWQTQRTQNPPTLAVMGVRPPLPAPYVYVFGIISLMNAGFLCA
jgi:hypothetical protein